MPLADTACASYRATDWKPSKSLVNKNDDSRRINLNRNTGGRPPDNLSRGDAPKSMCSHLHKTSIAQQTQPPACTHIIHRTCSSSRPIKPSTRSCPTSNESQTLPPTSSECCQAISRSPKPLECLDKQRNASCPTQEAKLQLYHCAT